MNYRLFVFLLAAAVLAGSASASAQSQYAGDGVPSSLEEEIRWRVNRGRFDSASENQLRNTAYTGLPATSGPLAPNQYLRLAAQHQSTDLATRNLFQHETVTGSAYYNPTTQPEPWDRMLAEGYSWNYAGENICAGYVGSEAAYVGWWNSSGHRANMYDSGFREIGIGSAYSASSTYKWYYTMDLGSSGSVCFFTDTLFQDANTNGLYEAAEGISNVVVSLLVGSSPLNTNDISTALGSFAVPITSIASGATVHVMLSNANTSTVTLSLPRDYRNYTTISLAPREKRECGTFVRASGAQNVGLRQLTPAPATPQLRIAAAKTGTTLNWTGVAGFTNQVQWSTNLVLWNVLTNVQPGSTNISVSDVAASGAARRFYRVVIR